MKEVTKTVNQYEIGDLVMLVKDTKFGGPKKKTIVRVTSSQGADGFFMGDVITGEFVTGERFHWANVRLLTAKEIASNKRRIIKNLMLSKSDVLVTYSNKNINLSDSYYDDAVISMTLAEAKQFANFINTL